MLTDIETLMERESRKNVGGILCHYTYCDGLNAILEGKQLRLTRFDKMFMGSDEGKYIFLQLDKALEELHMGSDTELYKLLMKKIGSFKDTAVMPHLFDNSSKCEDSIPYVICFTVENNINSKISKYIDAFINRDLFIQFQAGNMGLELSKLNGSDYQEINCYGAAKFMKIDYGSECLYEELVERIGLFANHYRLEEAVNHIIEYLCDRMLQVMPPSYSDQMECRLVFYVPVNEAGHSDIMSYVSNRRYRDEEGRLLEDVNSNPYYIYLNFSEDVDSITAVINPARQSVKNVEAIIEKWGYKPIVYNPQWPRA